MPSPPFEPRRQVGDLAWGCGPIAEKRPDTRHLRLGISTRLPDRHAVLCDTNDRRPHGNCGAQGCRSVRSKGPRTYERGRARWCIATSSEVGPVSTPARPDAAPQCIAFDNPCNL
ncbi:MAG: hypothetical protein QOE30_4918 [Mycobacterium sp.]|jgi:hypothetical protein|nr:hypothetical protein [Mycobacterium sp.]